LDKPVIKEIIIVSGCGVSGYKVGEKAIDNPTVVTEIDDKSFEYETQMYTLYNVYSGDKLVARIENGQVKYFRDYHGYLCRGVVFHNINNMWWVKLNEFNYTNIADFRLFDPTPEDFMKRRAKRNTRSGKTLVDDRNKDKTKFYYVWSKKHSNGSDLEFWGPSFSGYTSNLDDAGIYTLEDILKSSSRFETITKETVRQIVSSKENRDDSFLIACDDVQLLGKKVVKIAA
jgi:hypothetical protein